MINKQFLIALLPVTAGDNAFFERKGDIASGVMSAAHFFGQSTDNTPQIGYGVPPSGCHQPLGAPRSGSDSAGNVFPACALPHGNPCPKYAFDSAGKH
jgi:hypothetical protein